MWSRAFCVLALLGALCFAAWDQLSAGDYTADPDGVGLDDVTFTVDMQGIITVTSGTCDGQQWQMEVQGRNEVYYRGVTGGGGACDNTNQYVVFYAGIPATSGTYIVYQDVPSPTTVVQTGIYTRN